METVIYDPACQRSKEWMAAANDVDKFAEVVRKMPAERVKMLPWDVMFLMNPLPHEVTAITAGDRLCFVGFVGFVGFTS